LERRGLRPEDFAAFHPRGTLGWRALVRVADLMHTGDAVPMVREDVRMKDVLVEMTGKRLGMTTVVDQAGDLGGVITHGDPRRLYIGGEPIAELASGPAATRCAKLS